MNVYKQGTVDAIVQLQNANENTICKIIANVSNMNRKGMSGKDILYWAGFAKGCLEMVSCDMLNYILSLLDSTPANKTYYSVKLIDMVRKNYDSLSLQNRTIFDSFNRSLQLT